VWQTAANDYAKAVATITRKIETLSKEEYAWFSVIADAARHRSEDAQADLDAHIRDHDCHSHEASI
jgi:hypothetical protein